jgi:hypothetical protein
MKTKLTLTVRKSIILNAKRYSKKTGKSISQLFEEFFEEQDASLLPTETQRAAGRLLKALHKARSVKTQDDKKLLKAHVAKKYS